MTITTRIARCIALPAVSAGILGGAALGLAGMANAGTYPTHDPSPRPGIVATPNTTNHPPVYPHWRWRDSGSFAIHVPLGGDE